MAEYKPNLPFNTPIQLLKRSMTKVNGANQPVYTPSITVFCSAKSYGGTEKEVNGVTVIEDTWSIDTCYHPDFQKGDHIRFLDDSTEYEILASPENIERKCRYMKFKVQRIGG